MKAVTARHTLLAWLALLALTGTSFALSYAHLGPAGVPVALLIAAVKVSIVAVIFMELLDEPFTVRATLVAAFTFLLLLVFFMAADVVTRARPPLLPHLAEPARAPSP
jgi:cytochrome c oxidase subunit 4